MKPKISNFGRKLKENVSRPKSSGGENHVRPTKNILYSIVAVYCLICILGVAIGAFFAEPLTSLIGSDKIMNDGALWLPFVVVGFILLMGLWAVMIFFNAVVASRQKQAAVGIIESMEIRSYYDTDDGDVYYIQCSVVFEVHGEIFRSSGRLRYDSTERKEVEAKIVEIGKGTEINILYDANNPNSITLESMDTDIRGEFFSGIGFIIGGFAGSVFLGVLITGF